MNCLERRIEAASGHEGVDKCRDCLEAQKALAASDEVLHELLDKHEAFMAEYYHYPEGFVSEHTKQMRAALMPRREKNCQHLWSETDPEYCLRCDKERFHD